MIRSFRSLVLAVVLPYSMSAHAYEVSALSEIDSSSRSGESKDELKREVAALKDRTRALEATVLELRSLVRYLSLGTQPRGYDCVLKNSWDTYIGRGVTKSQAAAIAVKNCEKDHAAMFCRSQPTCEEVQ